MTTSKKIVKVKPVAPKPPARKAPAALAASAARAAPAVPAQKRLPVTTGRVATADLSPKPEKPKKPKLVRDSFTIPKSEYAVLESLKQRAAKAGALAKKSEILRAGIKALSAMDDAAFRAAMGAVPAIKTGRPANA